VVPADLPVTGRAAVPAVERVFAAVPAGVHPVELARWFTSPHVDLVVGPDETPLQPALSGLETCGLSDCVRGNACAILRIFSRLATGLEDVIC
jgi:hypothetical protein